MKKKYLIFLLLLSFPLYTWADKTLDSLLNVIQAENGFICVGHGYYVDLVTVK